MVAIDLGAESGRALVGLFDGSRLTVQEVHRFRNEPLRRDDRLMWDIDLLRTGMLDGLRRATSSAPVATIGVDGWGVDFGLLDGAGRLLAPPVHYRDPGSDGMVERALTRLSRADIFGTTGTQLLPINTLYRLLAMVSSGDPSVQAARTLLMIPDLMNRELTGLGVTEYTQATTTQCYDTRRGTWAREMLARLGIPDHFLPEVMRPGTRLGPVTREIADVTGTGGAMVVVPATHDTASAVAGLSLGDDGSTAFLSSGTWSSVGLEIDTPDLSRAALAADLSNEGGVDGRICFLRNVTGLWLIQECRRAFDPTASRLSYENLAHLAGQASPFVAFIDPDDPRFGRPGDLRAVVHEYCRETGQLAPDDAGGLARVILDSLALKYAATIRDLGAVRGRPIRAIRIVGGGAQHELLCRLTAAATGLPVASGPIEATAIGNLAVQALAIGELGSLAEARAMIRRSFPVRQFEPAGDWSAARERFDAILQRRRTAA
ncbi:MAG: rhamnulokinase [Chloroflexi bacterium]|nr:rhamnulokinase [Chloroflexota bacterium]